MCIFIKTGYSFYGPVWHHKGKISSTAFFSALILKTGASKGAKVSRKFTDRLEAHSVSAWKSVTETEFLQLIGPNKKNIQAFTWGEKNNQRTIQTYKDQVSLCCANVYLWNRDTIWSWKKHPKASCVTFRCDDWDVAGVKLIQCDAEFMHDWLHPLRPGPFVLGGP